MTTFYTCYFLFSKSRNPKTVHLCWVLNVRRRPSKCKMVGKKLIISCFRMIHSNLNASDEETSLLLTKKNICGVSDRSRTLIYRHYKMSRGPVDWWCSAMRKGIGLSCILSEVLHFRLPSSQVHRCRTLGWW